jgi:hypothetical protein
VVEGAQVSTGTVIHLRPSQFELNQAWHAYDAAQLHVVALYKSEASTAAERRAAVTEAARLHRIFCDIMERMDRR